VLPDKHKGKIKAKLDGAMKKFFWNGAIRSVYISYIEIAINCGAQISMMLNGSKYQQASEKLTGIVMLLYLVTVIVFWAGFIKKK